MTGLEVEKIKVNLNTIVAMVGFLSTFAILVTMWNDQQNAQQNTDRWVSQHDQVHLGIIKDLQGLHDEMTTRALATLDLTSRVGQVEKAVELGDGRINRIVDSYSGQITDIRTSLSAITTQLALTNQSLQRLEAAGKLTLTVPNDLKAMGK